MADRSDDKRRSKGYGSRKEMTESDEEFEEEIKDLPMIEREQRTVQRLERKEKEARRQQMMEKGPGKNQASILNSLQNKRQIAKDRKAARERSEDEASFSDEDEESDGEISNSKKSRRRRDDDDDDYVDEEEERRALRNRAEKKRKSSPERKSPERSLTLTMEVLEKNRISRKSLALLCSHPIFEKTVQGGFVRVNQSSGPNVNVRASAHDYAIAQIVRVETYKKAYKIDDKETDKILILKHGNKERPMKMCFVSNSEFTGAEFTKWINRMQRENEKTPSVDDIERKAKEIQKGLSYRYSDDEIRQNIDKRIDDKLAKGELLTTYEIELLENKRIQREKEYHFSNRESDKHAMEKIENDIKKAKARLKEKQAAQNKPVEKKNIVERKKEEVSKGVQEEEPEERNGDGMAIEGEIEEEDEIDKQREEKLIEEMKKKGMTMTEIYDEMKREFLKNHKVDLNLDKLVDDWNIETEVA
jgi:RNA polymerase-associated protein RTF1